MITINVDTIFLNNYFLFYCKMSYNEDKSTQFSGNNQLSLQAQQLVIVKSNAHKIKPDETSENRN